MSAVQRCTHVLGQPCDCTLPCAAGASHVGCASLPPCYSACSNADLAAHAAGSDRVSYAPWHSLCRYHFVSLGSTPNLCFDSADSECLRFAQPLFAQYSNAVGGLAPLRAWSVTREPTRLAALIKQAHAPAINPAYPPADKVRTCEVSFDETTNSQLVRIVSDDTAPTKPDRVAVYKSGGSLINRFRVAVMPGEPWPFDPIQGRVQYRV